MPASGACIPISPRLPVMVSTTSPATAAPPRATHSDRAMSGAKIAASTKASHAPDDTPMVMGDTSGFCVNCCIRLPASPSAAPTSPAMASRGKAP